MLNWLRKHKTLSHTSNATTWFFRCRKQNLTTIALRNNFRRNVFVSVILLHRTIILYKYIHNAYRSGTLIVCTVYLRWYAHGRLVWLYYVGDRNKGHVSITCVLFSTIVLSYIITIKSTSFLCKKMQVCKKKKNKKNQQRINRIFHQSFYCYVLY